MSKVDAASEQSTKAFGWAARESSGLLSPFHFSRRHECVGVVTGVGNEVQKFKIGDKVGMGCLAGACKSCNSCSENLENYCSKMMMTVNGKQEDGSDTYGGLSDIMVSDERFLVLIPENLPLDSGAPVLGAGVTVYSSLKYFGLDKPGLHVGVMGLGGLGHLAVKYTKAMGARVTVLSTSSSRQKEAIEHLDTDSFLITRDQDQMKAAISTMDGIIDTVSAIHPLAPLIGLLKPHGKLVIVGSPPEPFEIPIFPLLMGRKLITGSYVGGMKELEEAIDFAAKHNIKADIEVIMMDYVTTAMDRLAKGDVKYRFVVDIAKSLDSSV